MPDVLVAERPGLGARRAVAPSGQAVARAVLWTAGVALVALALVFWFRWPAIGVVWPFVLTNGAFLAAISVSIAAPVFFIAWTGDFGAVRAGGVTLGAVYLGFVVAIVPMVAGGANALAPYLAVYLVAVVGNVLMFRWAARYPVQDARETPAPVLWVFAISTILLVVPGLASLMGLDFMPSPQSPENLRFYGAIYAGAGAFFVWGLIRPTWSNARIVLLSFLVYDLARFLVFPQMLPRFVADPAGMRIASWIYWVAVFASAIFSAVYLFALPRWRIWGRREP